jgi:hypothetical protein
MLRLFLAEIIMRTKLALAVTMVASIPSFALACASCGCSLSTDWESQGLTSGPGWRLDLRYDYINQSQLRNSTGKVDRGAYLPFPQADEIEQGTTNRYTTVGIDYSPNRDWGVNLQLPYVDRFHQTVAPGDTDTSESDTHEFGDVRLTGRYQGFSVAHNIGVTFGLKLPSGEYKQNFNRGVQAGNPLDRGLQAGTGSTDLLLGIFRADALNRDWDWFARAQYQRAIAIKDDYRPGHSINLSGGLRYLGYQSITPELQLNFVHSGHDRGANGDEFNSGSTLLYLSPGITWSVNKQVKLYGYVQLPVHQNVEGFQLAPRWAATAGVRYAF